MFNSNAGSAIFELLFCKTLTVHCKGAGNLKTGETGFLRRIVKRCSQKLRSHEIADH